MLATISGATLTAELKPQLALLVDDMRERLSSDIELTDRWRAQHREAVAQERTAVSWTDWCDDQLTQAAVGWLLTSVFVRFCEDNLLLGDTAVWITHPDLRLRQRALDAENAFYQAETDKSYREWLEVAFAALRANRATAALVDKRAAIEIAAPSSYAVNQVLQFWRRTDDDGNLLWRFNEEGLSTRFLGDLYQDLSDYAKKKYALLQTPEFVEEFILDQTLTPALKDRPLERFTLIDPTCGSGHFLLGAFARLVDLWHREAPGMDARARVNKALESIYGVDINPFAVAIATFRLIVAALKETGDRSLVNAPAFTLNLVNGDSLLHGPDALGRTAFDYDDERVDKDAVAARFAYRTEDLPKLRKFLAPGQYDVVVGNPPYITVKDKALNARYRELYSYCKGTYALTVPFMEKFFGLAKPGERAGWVGQITSNSFMKREFGVPLIEEFIPTVDIKRVIDSEGAWIPGHNMDGTPTVILIGRNRKPTGPDVLCVLGLGRREKPGDAAAKGFGPYWESIIDHSSQEGYEDEWVSVVRLSREAMAKHPWSLNGGGAVELLSAIEQSSTRLETRIELPIGRSIRAGADEAFMRPKDAFLGVDADHFRPVVLGEEVRDWSLASANEIFYPYRYGTGVLSVETAPTGLWFLRRSLQERQTFQGNMADAGLTWWSYMQHTASAYATPLSITFAEVATHNHFVLDRGGKVFKQTAPVIKLRADAAEEDHLQLVGTLNSSTGCFWLKQMTKAKGGAAAIAWARTYQYNGTTVKDFPLPSGSSLPRARHLDALAQQLSTHEPAIVLAQGGVKTLKGDQAIIAHAKIRAQMVAEQEELDWEVYHNYGLIDEKLFWPAGEAPGIALGERAFEIALARKMEAGEVETEWFARHGSAPITELSGHWPATYRDLVERRLAVIESNPHIRLLEQPEYKRRWAGDSWDVKLQRALQDWLLGKLEDRSLWFTTQGTPQPLSVGELAGHVEKDSEFIATLDLWAGQNDTPVTPALEKLLADQLVPYLAAWRYKDSGLRKRAEWEHVWSLQRDEDAGLIKATDIPVPPKYSAEDFMKQSYWSHRGKLDVPKERFIVYPGAGRVTDPTPLIGWAGWDYAQRGIALATIYAQREADGTAFVELIPVVAGIAELLPWVKQWHSRVDPTFNLNLADYLAAQLAEKSVAVGVPVSDLADWRPTTTTTRREKT
jgi:hypothetical protein